MKTIVCEPAEFAARAAREIASRLGQSLARRPEIHVALAGGETPRPVYRLLARDPGLGPGGRGRPHFYWSDERLVDATDPASNVGLARRELLEPLAVPEDRIHPPRVVGDALESDQAARAYEELIRDLVPPARGDATGIPRFDLVLLGLGEDGHTASLFPGKRLAPGRLVIATRAPRPPRDRISFAFELLNAAAELIVLARGSGKAEAVRRILELRDPGLPAARLDPGSGSLTWILDRGAAGRLSGGTAPGS